MSDLQAKFSTLETQLAAQQADMMILLLNIFNTLDVMNSNNSINAQRIIAALAQNACPCDPDAPLLPVPLEDTPYAGTDAELCQRIQYFVDLMRLGWGLNMASYLSVSGGINSSAVYNFLAQALIDVSIADGEIASPTPVAVRDQIANAMLLGAGELGASEFAAELGDMFRDTALWASVIDALYGAGYASSAASAYAGAINASSYGSLHKSVAIAMFYSAWPNSIWAALPVVDASSYDGEACGSGIGASCLTLVAVPYTRLEGGSGYAIASGIPDVTWVATVGTSSGTRTFTPAIFFPESLAGWTIRNLAGFAYLQYRVEVPSSDAAYLSLIINDEPDDIATMPVSGTMGIIATDGAAFTVRLCPPGQNNPPA